MKSTTCDVHHDGQHTSVVDGLLPAPTSIKEQMPLLAAALQSLAANLGRESVQLQVRASMDIRRAFDMDDFRAVRDVYQRGHGWINAQEAGFQLGVPSAHMQAFNSRHRGGIDGAH